MTAANPMARVRVEGERVYLLEPEKPVGVLLARMLLQSAQKALDLKKARVKREACLHVVELPYGRWLARRGITSRRQEALAYNSLASAERGIGQRNQRGSLSDFDTQHAKAVAVRLMEVR